LTAVDLIESQEQQPRTGISVNPDAAESVTRAEQIALGWITLLGIVCRLAALRQPMRYDESVTWAYFVGRPWHTIVSQYQFPNNHVLYSLLAKATSSLAPWAPWALRLPALVAGIAIVPLTWAVGRRFADRESALLGAALAAVSTPLALYSTNARGYSLIVVLFLCMLLQAHRMRPSPRVRDYAIVAMLATLGLYTIPVMLYPMTVVAVWLSLDWWKRPDGIRRMLLLIGSCVSAAVIAGILYLPIIRTAGLAALAGNKFVAPSSWFGLARSLPHFAIEVATTWAEPAPALATLLVVLFAVNGMKRSMSSLTPSLSWSAIAGCALVLVVTRRAPFVRVWLFLLPLYLIAVARGCIQIWLRVTSGPASQWPTLILATALAAFAVGMRGAETTQDTGSFPSARDVVALLAPHLRPGDRVLAPIPSNGPLLYYMSERGLDTASLTVSLVRAERAFLVLDVLRGQSIPWALSSGMIDRDQFTEPMLVGRAGDAELWSADRR